MVISGCLLLPVGRSAFRYSARASWKGYRRKVRQHRATNVLRTLGPAQAAAVLLLDAGKVLAAYLGSRYLALGKAGRYWLGSWLWWAQLVRVLETSGAKVWLPPPGPRSRFRGCFCGRQCFCWCHIQPLRFWQPLAVWSACLFIPSAYGVRLTVLGLALVMTPHRATFKGF